MADLEITHDDLLSALLAAQTQEGDDGRALTSQEIQERTGWSDKRVRARLHELQRAGKLSVVWVQRLNLFGAMQARPGYQLKELP